MKKTIHIKLERKESKIVLCISAPTEFEEFFKTLSEGDIRTSDFWLLEGNGGSKFYSLTPKYAKVEEAVLRSTSIKLFSDYGKGLFNSDGSSINIAPLRTVGISEKEGVKLESDRFLEVNNMDFELYSKEIAKVAKRIYDLFISERTVRAVITLEV